MKVKANKIELSLSQIEFYDKFGYLIVPDVYSANDCEEIKKVAAGFADSDHSVYINIHCDSEFFMEIMKDSCLTNLVKTVQKHKIVGLNDQYLFKKSGSKYGKQAWDPHQDNAYVKARSGAYLQVHIFLDDHDRENGGVYYFPGSQKEDILPYEVKPSWREPVGLDGLTRPGRKCKIPEKYEKVDVVGSKGSVCLQHGNIIHGSYPNLSANRDRQQYSLAYLNQGASYTRGRNSVKNPILLE